MTAKPSMKSPSRQTEDKTVLLAKRGDIKAVAELYAQNHEGIFRFLWSRTNDYQLAEDLTGEVFTRMVSALPDYDPRGFSIRVWLFRIARNLLTDYYRKESKVSKVTLDVESSLIEPKLVENEVDMRISKEDLFIAIDKISQLHQEVIVLRFINGLSLKETAKTLDKSVSAVKALQHRGLLALRAALSEDSRLTE